MFDFNKYTIDNKILSIEDSIKLFKKEREAFYDGFYGPLCNMIETAIIKRIREIDNRPVEYIKRVAAENGKDAMYEVELPFLIDFEDDECNETYYDILWNGADSFGSSVVTLAHYNKKEEKYDEFTLREVDDLIYVYRKLVRMGFFEVERTEEFRVE